jgi:hypothetical protein
MKKDKLVPERMEAAERISEHITAFFNAAFGRRTRPSRQLADAVYSALSDRYREDEIRLAYWVARCLTGKASWLSEKLRTDMLPHIVLRHSGAVNSHTGKPSVRWLDDLLARASEAHPNLIKALLVSLPESMQAGERELLARMEIPIGE